MNNEILVGDCIDTMRLWLDDSSVDAIVTDPPYELGFMGKKWDNTGIANNTEMWAECLRVLKPGGYLLSFGGSRTYHRMACAVEDAGFEIRDQIMWVYGSGFPKSHNLDGEWNGWGTALKPAHEPICVARKPFKGTVADNTARFGTGAFNIDGCRVGDELRFNASASHNEIFGQFKGSETDGRVAVGRWPANIIHDGSDEVLQAFAQYGERGAAAPVKGTEPSNATKSVFGQINRKASNAFHGDTGTAARFFYCAKASKRDRDEGLDGLAAAKTNDGRKVDADNAYQRGATLRQNTHPTVKPTELMAYLCRLVTPAGGLVLDPFAGSGSTGKAAVREGYRFLGIEMSAEYADIARRRLAWALKEAA